MKHLDNGFLLLKARHGIMHLPHAVLYYEEYNDLKALNERSGNST